LRAALACNTVEVVEGDDVDVTVGFVVRGVDELVLVPGVIELFFESNEAVFVDLCLSEVVRVLL
jgi:hypothetical protein